MAGPAPTCPRSSSSCDDPGMRATRFWVVGFVGAAFVGILVGGGAYLLLRATGGRDGWADLVAVLVGIMLGLGAALITWVVLLAILVRRYVAPGRQLVVVLAALGVVALTVVAAWAAVRLSGGDSVALNQGATAAAVLAAAIAPPVLVGTLGPAKAPSEQISPPQS